VGVKERRVEKYYQDLLASNGDSKIKSNHQNTQLDDNDGKTNGEFIPVPEKWKGQIEKVLTCDTHFVAHDAVIFTLQH
jgi:hypothetical protein